MEKQAETPYWASKPGVAAIKAEYVLWKEIHPKNRPAGLNLDVSEANHAAAHGDLPPPPPLDDDDAAEGRPVKDAAESNGVSDLSRSTEEPPRKRQKASGQNKGRQFARIQEEGVKLCNSTARGEECTRQQKQGLPECTNSHDLKAYLDENKEDDINLDRPDVEGAQKASCPSFENLGACPFGFRCRFMWSHITRHDDPSAGFQGTGLSLVYDYDKIRSVAPSSATTDEELLNWVYETRGELNVVGPEKLYSIRKTKTEDLPTTKAYLQSIGEALDTRVPPGGRGGKSGRGGRGRGGRGDGRQKDSGWGGRDGKNTYDAARENPTSNGAGFDKPRATVDDTLGKPENADPSVKIVEEQKDTPDVPLRPAEKKRLHFENKLYLAPLTTVGNLPFRRLCVQYGADITCGEMGLAQEYMAGNKNEFSLLRRHPSEKIFGVQLCGNRPQTLVSATEMIKAQAPDLDFIDVNLGCPIDLVVKKGAGSALLDSGNKLGKILRGMNIASGDTPITIKMRTGIKTGINTTHKLMPRTVKEWGVGAVTIHGRTQQQRYSKTADYDYIKTCVDSLRSTAEELDIPAIPIFGNGDAFDHREYWNHVEETGVDGIMIARGALIKPWIFTEIAERRDWDISSRERLDMIGDLAKYGLEHWGSDTMGLNTTRRFMCEALSFTYRYIPVGLLERLPAKMSDRPYQYRGRDDLETLLASDNSQDWVKITNMFLGPPPSEWSFTPKHKSNAYGAEESNG